MSLGSSRGRFAALSALVGLLLCSGPAVGDWLVMRDGSRVETDGPWRVDGRRILFDLPNGTLSTVRASEVDLEASRSATEAAATAAASAAAASPDTAAPAAPRERPTPVLVLTDKDIARAAPVDEGALSPEAADDSRSTSTVTEPLTVGSWETHSTRDGFGTEIRGVVVNRGMGVRAGIELQVEIEDIQGATHQASAFLRNTVLESGTRTSFRAVFPTVGGVAGEPRFELDSLRVAADPDGLKLIDEATGEATQTIRSDEDFDRPRADASSAGDADADTESGADGR